MNKLVPLLVPATSLAIWHFSVLLFSIPPYILPSPLAVFAAFVEHHSLLFSHASVTLLEVAIGFIIGSVFGMLLGTLMGISKFCNRALYPYVIASQVFPKEALAPLFAIWFGFGLMPKIIISAIIAFFPVAISTMRGLHHVDPMLSDLFEQLNASRWQMFLKLRLPSALPQIMTSLRMAIPLAIIGAIIGEFIAASRGLGYLIRMSSTEFSTEMIFAALIVLGIIGSFLYVSFVYLERFVLSRHAAARLVDKE